MTKNGTATTKRFRTESASVQPTIYQIRIEGHLDDQWTDWFSDLSVCLEENGDTLLTGPVADQSALFGLLKKVRDLGMPLVSINRVDSLKSDVAKGEINERKIAKNS